MGFGIASAIIGGGAALLGSKNNSKAINRATTAQTEGTAASTALLERVDQRNRADLGPFVDRGNVAGSQINALLGLGGEQPTARPAVQPNTLAQFRGYPGGAGVPYGLGDSVTKYTSDYAFRPGAGRRLNGSIQPSTTYGVNLPSAGGPIAAQSGPQSAQGAASDAFDIFRNSTGYQFRVNEGMDALNSGYAGSGLLQSGAALRALDGYRQNMASAEFGNYLGYLGQQQGAGLSAAGAQAGVGVDYASNVANLNAQNASALANSAVASANNNNALIGQLGGLASSVLGGL